MATCFPLATIQALAMQRRILFANKRAERNATELGWSIDNIVAFICGLTVKHHRGIRPGLSIFDGRGTLDADKYVARFDEETGAVVSNSRHCAFFVELGIKQLASGDALLVISFHLDGQP